MDVQEQIDKICTDSTITPWDKLCSLLQLIYPTKLIPDKLIQCPYCYTIITKHDIASDKDIVEFDLNNQNELFYRTKTPCCDKTIEYVKKYTLTTISEMELLTDLRKILLNEMREAQEEYRITQERYRLICDLIYNKDTQEI